MSCGKRLLKQTNSSVVIARPVKLTVAFPFLSTTSNPSQPVGKLLLKMFAYLVEHVTSSNPIGLRLLTH